MTSHKREDGSCDCPGKCQECGTPCNDHDLAGNTWLCDACVFKGLAEVAQRKITAITCGPQCIDDNPHKWDGPVVKFERGGSVSCSKCGRLAIEVDMWELP